MNPYNEIDKRRMDINAMAAFGPSSDLPPLMKDMWPSCVKYTASRIAGMMDRGQRPPAHEIFMFNVMSQGQRPFNNDTFQDFATKIALVYLAELKANNAGSHNEAVFKDIANKMVDWYSKAQIMNSSDLQRVTPPDARGQVEQAAKNWQGALSRAENILSGGSWGGGSSSWGGQGDAWGSQGSSWGGSNDSWGSDVWGGSGSTNSGWGAQDSWAEAASQDHAPSNTSGWESGNHNTDSGDGFFSSGGWGSDDAFGDYTEEKKGTPAQSNGEILDPAAAALAALFAEDAKAETAKTDETKVEEKPSGTAPGLATVEELTDSEIDWEVADDMELPDWMNEDVQVVDATTLDEAFDEIQEPVDILDLLANPSVTMLSETVAMPEGFDIDDVDQYHRDLLQNYDDVPGYLIPTASGAIVFAATEAAVYKDPQRFLESYGNELRFGRTICTDGKSSVFLINDKMYGVAFVIDLDDHDIYHVKAEEMGELLLLAEEAQPENRALKEAVRENITFLELGEYHNVSEAQVLIEREFLAKGGKNTVVANGMQVNNSLPCDDAFVAPNYNSLYGLLNIVQGMETEYPRIARMLERFYLKNAMYVVNKHEMGNKVVPTLAGLYQLQETRKEGDALKIAALEVTNATLVAVCEQLDNVARSIHVEVETLGEAGDTHKRVKVLRDKTLIKVRSEAVTGLSELFESNADQNNYRISMSSLSEEMKKHIDWSRTTVGYLIGEDRLAHIWPTGGDWLQITVDEIL